MTSIRMPRERKLRQCVESMLPHRYWYMEPSSVADATVFVFQASREDGYFIVDRKVGYNEVQSGPFPSLEAATAAWFVLYGRE